jgi:hypothetical protein
MLLGKPEAVVERKTYPSLPVDVGNAAGMGERGDLSCNLGVGARRTDFNGLGVEDAGGEMEYEGSSGTCAVGRAVGTYAGKGSFALTSCSGGDKGAKALEGGRVIRSIVSLSEGNNCASTSGRFVMWLSRFTAFLGVLLPPWLAMENRLFSTGFNFSRNSKEESELDEMGMKAEFRRDSNLVLCWCES